MTALDRFLAMGGTVERVWPPIPVTRKSHYYQAFHPSVIDIETGGERSIASGRTAEDAAQDALDYWEIVE